MWEEKFLAISRGKVYTCIINGTDTNPKSIRVLDTSNEIGKAAKKARDTNDDAYEDAMLSIDRKNKDKRVAFGIVKGCRTNDLPDGDVYLVQKRLCNTYVSKSTSPILKLKT